MWAVGAVWVMVMVVTGLVTLAMALEVPWGFGTIPSGDPADGSGYAIGGAVVLAGVLGGAVMGGIEWLVLRRWFVGGRRWVLASAVSMMVSFTAAWAIGGGIGGSDYAHHALPHAVDRAGLMGGVLIGASLGAAQWLVLRSQISTAGWWIVANVIGFAGGWTVTAAVSEPIDNALGPMAHLAGGLLFGAVFGVVSGGVLLVMLQAAYRGARLLPQGEC